MSTVNVGSQIITWQYKTPLTAITLNTALEGFSYPGLLNRPNGVINGTSLTIKPFSLLINPSDATEYFDFNDDAYTGNKVYEKIVKITVTQEVSGITIDDDTIAIGFTYKFKDSDLTQSAQYGEFVVLTTDNISTFNGVIIGIVYKYNDAFYFTTQGGDISDALLIREGWNPCNWLSIMSPRRNKYTYTKLERRSHNSDGTITGLYSDDSYGIHSFLPVMTVDTSSYTANILYACVENCNINLFASDYISQIQGCFGRLQKSNGIYKTYPVIHQQGQIHTDYLKRFLLDSVYPVGSLYWSSKNVSPETFLGGTWNQIKDTFVLAAGDNFAAGTNGGTATSVLTNLNLPSHIHMIMPYKSESNFEEIYEPAYNKPIYTKGSTPSTGETATCKVVGLVDSKTGSNPIYLSNDFANDIYAGPMTQERTADPFTNLPPYVAKYCWERTA